MHLIYFNCEQLTKVYSLQIQSEIHYIALSIIDLSLNELNLFVKIYTILRLLCLFAAITNSSDHHEKV